jgi:hypothetical protein
MKISPKSGGVRGCSGGNNELCKDLPKSSGVGMTAKLYRVSSMHYIDLFFSISSIIIRRMK